MATSPPEISVIIPTWCERRRIAQTVRHARELGQEVIVVDAHSPDGTAQLARAAGARVVSAPKGRGRQLHAGALEASGQALLFLHADTRLSDPRAARSAIQTALSDPAIHGGNFYLLFSGADGASRLFTWANHLRRRWLRIYYGDSCIFIRRHTYFRLGGFAPHPVCEDYDLVRRLERLGPTAYIRHVSAQTSSRRYDGRVLHTLGSWVIVQGLFSLGVSPEWIARCCYRDRR